MKPGRLAEDLVPARSNERRDKVAIGKAARVGRTFEVSCPCTWRIRLGRDALGYPHQAGGHAHLKPCLGVALVPFKDEHHYRASQDIFDRPIAIGQVQLIDQQQRPGQTAVRQDSRTVRCHVKCFLPESRGGRQPRLGNIVWRMVSLFSASGRSLMSICPR
jgi:hypothetical protein